VIGETEARVGRPRRATAVARSDEPGVKNRRGAAPPATGPASFALRATPDRSPLR
jgi:hypothetical protein